MAGEQSYPTRDEFDSPEALEAERRMSEMAGVNLRKDTDGPIIGIAQTVRGPDGEQLVDRMVAFTAARLGLPIPDEYIQKPSEPDRAGWHNIDGEWYPPEYFG